MISVVLGMQARDESNEVRLERVGSATSAVFTAHLGDHQCDVEIDSTSERRGTLRMHGKVLPFRAWRQDGRIQVWIAGRIHEFEIVRRVARRAGEAGAATPTGDLTAPMPGTVLKINVEAGDRFEAHDPLIILESMKMEMSLSSPQPGRVKEIKCQEGDLVELGELLAKLEDV